MSTSKALDGFRPSRVRGSGANSTGNSEYPIASGYASNIFSGDIALHELQLRKDRHAYPPPSARTNG